MKDNARFYVYEWYNKNTGEVFYVGKGTGDRHKTLKHRNSKFLDYVENNIVDNRIVKDNLTEEESFLQEKKLIEYYKNNNQCSCNLMEGGTGGVSFVWTDEARQYWSENNPMKSQEQRERMKNNNPMKNPEVAKKVGATKRRAVVINGIEYESCIAAAAAEGVVVDTIYSWCKRGYNTQGKPCRYADENQKEYTIPKKGKAVLIDGIYYPTLKDAAKALGVSDTSPLCKALKNHKLYKGHICEYANQQPS